MRKEQDMTIVYEARANLADHPKIAGTDGASSNLGM